MSFSRHWSTVYFGGSKRWSRKLSDIVSEKSSIGEISVKISSSPDLLGTLAPDSTAAATRARHVSLPSSQSNDAVCRARRSGTSSGSRILANETRFSPGGGGGVAVLRAEAKTGPSRTVHCGRHADSDPGHAAGLRAWLTKEDQCWG